MERTLCISLIYISIQLVDKNSWKCPFQLNLVHIHYFFIQMGFQGNQFFYLFLQIFQFVTLGLDKEDQVLSSMKFLVPE